MCGIAAIFRKSPVFLEEIQRLLSYILHRGPDGNHHQFLYGDRIAFGHSRLAIQDTSHSADQPMTTPDGRYTIIFNGEVYNFKELRSDLQSRGHRFRTTSDTEVILASFAEKGVDCLRDFNGMWALLIYDSYSEQCFLARDRFGVKPLYYCQRREELIACSEIDAIGRFLGNEIAENEESLENLVAQNTRRFGTESTHLDGVAALSPGCYAIWKPHEPLEIHRWYKLSRRDVPRRFSDQVHHFRELLTDACQLRLRSDVPVATCLSGGIDSGAIVCTLRDLIKKGVDAGGFIHRSFNAAFPGSPLDESKQTLQLANLTGIALDCHTIKCPEPEELETALHFCDGPMPALAFYPIWQLYKHIKHSGISVTLDGQGADEMLGGYFIGSDALLSGWQSRNPFRYWDLLTTYSSLHPHAPSWMHDAQALTRRYAFNEMDQAIKRPLKAVASLFGLHRSQPGKMPRPVAAPSAVCEEDTDINDWLAHKLWDQFFVNPLPFLLHQYDRCSMASGVECRMPFMDYRLVEFIFSLPLTSRVGGGYTKRVLREAMKDSLPDNIRLNRLKTGFNAPFDQWFSGPMRDWFQDQLNSEAFIANKYFDGRALREKYSQNKTNSSGNWSEREIWPCIHLTWWLRNRRSTIA